VAGFRTLPQVYPSGQKWTAEDNKLYKPITKDIVVDIGLVESPFQHTCL
jgi:hypothetical protein